MIDTYESRTVCPCCNKQIRIVIGKKAVKKMNHGFKLNQDKLSGVDITVEKGEV
jgi:hypothetical protein